MTVGFTAAYRRAWPLGGVLLATAAALVGFLLRYRFIEPEALGAACADAGPWWCAPRTALIVATEYNLFGWLSLACAIYAIVYRPHGAPAAHAALLIGGAGLILYNATVSAVAVVLTVLCLAYRTQRPAETPELGSEP